MFLGLGLFGFEAWRRLQGFIPFWVYSLDLIIFRDANVTMSKRTLVQNPKPSTLNRPATHGLRFRRLAAVHPEPQIPKLTQLT